MFFCALAAVSNCQMTSECLYFNICRRGHVVRQAGTADPADPASTADPDDEDLGDIELDADTEFGDMDEADGDFADEGDLGCEDLDDDDELPHDETAEQQHLVEGSIMHGAAYDMVSYVLQL